MRARKRSARPPKLRNVGIPADTETAFLVCTFSMLGKLAQTDGRVSEEETARVEKYIDESLKLDKKRRALALKVFREGASSPLELRDYAEKFASTYPDRVQLCDRMIGILVDLAGADGLLSPAEDEEIGSAAILLGLSQAGYKRIKEKHLVGKPTIH